MINKNLRINITHRSTITALILALCTCLFILSSTKQIYHSEVKTLLDIFRGSLASLIILIHFKNFRFPKPLLFLAIILMISALGSSSFFAGQISLSILISFILYKNDYRRSLELALTSSLLLITSIILFAKLGIIESSISTNHLAQDSKLVIEEKYDWGFWHANVISSLLAGCILTSLLINSSKHLIFSLLIYAIILTETISRTYILIPPALACFYCFYKIKAETNIILLLPLLATSFAGIFCGILFLLPELTRDMVGEPIYNLLNRLLSLRLVIAENSISKLSTLEYLIGFHGEKIEIDSLYLNLALSIGLIPCLLVLTFLAYLSIMLFKRRNSKELLIVALFILISNFEKTSGIGSLLFISALIIAYSEIHSKKNQYIERQIKTHSIK